MDILSLMTTFGYIQWYCVLMYGQQNKQSVEKRNLQGVTKISSSFNHPLKSLSFSGSMATWTCNSPRCESLSDLNISLR